MSKLEIISLSGVVYKAKSTGPSTEPCGTPYESATLSDSVFFYGLHGANLSNKKTKFEPAQIFQILNI